MESEKESELRSLVCELSRLFYQLGWAVGTGGSLCIRHEGLAVSTPSGVHKERMQPSDLFVVDLDGAVVQAPSPQAKLSDSTVLFAHILKARGAGSVMHSHGMACNMICRLHEGQSEVVIRQQEMIKGIEGLGFGDELRVPVIDNAPFEQDLLAPMAAALAAHPKACAVLVRSHGLYVWGSSWQSTKRHCECLHYLFQAEVEAHRLLGPAAWALPRRRRQHSHLLLDIEGTTTPLAFVKEVLFPYSASQMEPYLLRHWAEADLQAVAAELMKAAQADAPPAPPLHSLSAAGVAEYARYLIKTDRKLGALKTLQGRLWADGYRAGALKGEVYEDVAAALRRLSAEGSVKIAIYSSGSRQAQRLLFQHTLGGDLTPLLSAFFDTAVGPKQAAASYADIALSLGADPSSVLFVTDVLAEAQAAKAAGMDAVISLRPGNAPIAQEHAFPCISCFDQLDI